MDFPSPEMTWRCRDDIKMGEDLGLQNISIIAAEESGQQLPGFLYPLKPFGISGNLLFLQSEQMTYNDHKKVDRNENMALPDVPADLKRNVMAALKR